MMESKIPLPTDNIYKFYALFGLVLMVSTMAAFLYVHTTTNALGFEATVEYEELESKEHPTPAELKRKEMLEKRVQIAIADRKIYSTVLELLFGVGFFGAAFGFTKWHLVLQPKLDKLLDLQIEKAAQEVRPSRVLFKRPH